MTAIESFDVAVVGGGPAGSAAALTLARAGCRVLLADAQAQTPFKVGETLPPAAQPLLRDLGLAPRMTTPWHVPCPGNLAVWGSEEVTEQDFIRDVNGGGWHLDRPRFDAMLRDAAAEAGADLRTKWPLERWAYVPERGTWDVEFLSRGCFRRVSARWLIDATGRRALIATRGGAKPIRHDRLVAFCAVRDDAQVDDTDARTCVEAVEAGWWYSALLPRGQRMFAFFTDDDLPVAQLARAPRTFGCLLAATRHIGSYRCARTPFDRIRRFPAGSVSRTAVAGEGWLAVGDATLAFDPISSQGIFHALYTGLRGAQSVLAQLSGDTAARVAWTNRIGEVAAAYQKHLTQCYATERRWPSSLFWLRRHTVPTLQLEPAPPLRAELTTVPVV